MRVTAELVPARFERSVELPEGASGMDLLKALQLAPDAHLLLRGEVSIPLDEPLVAGETILVVSVVSGGAT